MLEHLIMMESFSSQTEYVPILLIVTSLLLLVSCTGSKSQPFSTSTRAPLTASSAPTPSPTKTLAPVARPFQYVAIGASDAVGVGASGSGKGWTELFAAALPTGSTYLNLGVSGSTLEQALTQQIAKVPAKTDVVTLWLCVNDLNAKVSPATYAATLDRALTTLLSSGVRVVLVGNVPNLTLVPVYATIDSSVLLSAVAAYNQAIASVVAAHPGALVVDLFEGSALYLNGAAVSPDGFHPSDQGYGRIADAFVESLGKTKATLR